MNGFCVMKSQLSMNFVNVDVDNNRKELYCFEGNALARGERGRGALVNQ